MNTSRYFVLFTCVLFISLPQSVNAKEFSKFTWLLFPSSAIVASFVFCPIMVITPLTLMNGLLKSETI